MIAQGGGYVRTFVDERHALKSLLEKALVQGKHTHYIKKLLDVMKQEAILLELGNTHEPILSQRELEILELVVADAFDRTSPRHFPSA